ncbi:C3a anaphylatoxin chemotactic receptor-like [Xyrauchen texanus]|uniref:C3a anaphylatoxin chemotactic receptor-like n=1 Tax=Xyrauchen texanus TaxID=154827 RepID=UPI0022427327|nr:C3a anaphylatoxin chemotactic receptor-like [Xyrauchen texanus]
MHLMTDFAPWVTKVTARALGQGTLTVMVQERHLWLNLVQIRDPDKAHFLNAPSPSSVYSNFFMGNRYLEVFLSFLGSVSLEKSTRINRMLKNISSITAMENDYISVISQIFFYLTFLLGVPGNVFVVYIAGMKMKRTVNTIWFLNLAIADLLCCLSTLVFIIGDSIGNNCELGSVVCKIFPLVAFVTVFASVFILSLISLDRFTQVITPVWAKNHRSLLLVRLSCAAAWILSIALNVPFMILTRTIEYDNITHCVVFDYDFETYRKFTVISFVFGFMIPLICIITCYGFIARKLGRSRFHSGRAFRIMSAVIVAFFLCLLPYHIVYLIRMFGVHQSVMFASRFVPLTVCLAFFNSCLNPVLYFFIGQDIKEKFKLSLKLKHVFKRAFSEEETQISQSTETQQIQSF